MDKGNLHSQGPPPPPYEVPAYSTGKQHRRRVLVRNFVSIRTLLSFAIASSLFWLCITVNRQFTRWNWSSRSGQEASPRLLQQFEESVAQCKELNRMPVKLDPSSRKTNPRWSASNGQLQTIVLRNATLFNGDDFQPHAVDIVFSKGIVESIHKTANGESFGDAIVYNVHGRYVTPGLVDMHSHHLSEVWPETEVSTDGNEETQETKSLNPMLRILDALKPYDIATKLILSGGITSSLILPGSINLIGGQGVPVKNVLYSGEHSEPVVDDILLERGVPLHERRRYMKMAFGENPKGIWGYTRQGNSWHLREHLQKAKILKENQDSYCHAISQGHNWGIGSRVQFIHQHGKLPFQLELEPTVAVLRGQVLVQNHNYEPEDMEAMLRISHEFGYRVRAFHHATEAWQVPHMLKEKGDNLTIALFAEFSLYKAEAYSPNLHAGHILDKHGIPVAYKSDHSMGMLSAKYLVSQAAVGHAFHLPEVKALQSVTSIPAKAIDLDFRVGHCKPGFDADIVVWDSHPLSVGATPLQVFVDGQAQLDQSLVEESMATTFTTAREGDGAEPIQPQVRYEPDDIYRKDICAQAQAADQNFIIEGIKSAFLENYPELKTSLNQPLSEPTQLVVEDGNIVCIGPTSACSEAVTALDASGKKVLRMKLQNGHVLPGFTVVSRALGITEIATLRSSGDGEAANQKIQDPESLVYAKYGVALDGKSFARARLGGVTRAITLPLADASGFVQGVSTEILTSNTKSITHGGIVQGDVALHLSLGEATKQSEGTISSGVHQLRKMLKAGNSKYNETLYGQVAAGEIPLAVYCNNKNDLAQLILIKKDFPKTNIVILGGREAPYVANDLAAANISVILSENRPAPDIFRDMDAVVGPPLTRSVASYLKEAGVTFALSIFENAMPVDYRIHDLGPEAGWAAKYANLNEEESVRLVTSNVESILGLKKSKDLVVFEGNPLRYGASVVFSFHADVETGKLELATCFPQEDEHAGGPRLQ